MVLGSVRFIALVLTALALVPSGAHLLELPGKIGLSQDDYFVVQEIYRGWALFGFVLVGAITATFVLAVLLYGSRTPFVLACAAFLLITTTLAVFYLGAFPANQATGNWTVVPDNWRALRSQWEFGHATAAVLTFVAFCALVLEAVGPRRPAAR
ncbi:MAG: hypothetical protein ACFCUW_17750 [Kiloniellaceae bacterium]